jgi:hypothetical protein
VVARRITTQSNRASLEHWPDALTETYVQGAYQRAVAATERRWENPQHRHAPAKGLMQPLVRLKIAAPHVDADHALASHLMSARLPSAYLHPDPTPNVDGFSRAMCPSVGARNVTFPASARRNFLVLEPFSSSLEPTDQ